MMSMSMKKLMVGGMLVAGALSQENPCNLIDCPADKSVCVVEKGAATCVAKKFAFPAGCRSAQVFEASSGTLDYPVGSGKYSNHEKACFYFKCPGKRAELQWKAFETESGYDFVSAHAVSGGVISVASPLLSWHSGNKVPSNTVVEGEDGIFVHFTSDYSVKRTGFELDWTCEGTLLSVGDVCYQFCEAGDCAPVNKRDQCPTGTECKGDGSIGFNSRHTCVAPKKEEEDEEELSVGDVCYQFCEAGDCAPVNKRDQCPTGTVCKGDGSIGFNSHHTCQQEVLAVGDVCYQFCEAGNCAPVNKRDQCPTGTVCKGDGSIGFNSHHTCQQEVLAVGDVCYQFCEAGDCAPVNKRDQCPTGTVCKGDGSIGFNSRHTCSEEISVGDVCYRFCEGGNNCVPVSRREQCPSGSECKSTGAIGFNSESTCQAVLSVGDVCYQFCESGSCAPVNRREQCPTGSVCQGNGQIGFNSLETCVSQ